MNLILLRHGESARNIGLEVATEENCLTIKGVHQAVDVAKDLTKRKIDAIYCSSAKRCEQTMDEILRLRDENLPIHFSTLISPKLSSENFEKLKSRVELFIDDLKYDHNPNETVLIISHKLVIEMMIYLIKKEKKEIGNGELFEVIL